MDDRICRLIHCCCPSCHEVLTGELLYYGTVCAQAGQIQGSHINKTMHGNLPKRPFLIARKLFFIKTSAAYLSLINTREEWE
jgi:hypothetical protein